MNIQNLQRIFNKAIFVKKTSNFFVIKKSNKNNKLKKIFFKIATPIRYLTSIAGIQLAFRLLRKFGMLRPEGGYRKALKARRTTSPKL